MRKLFSIVLFSTLLLIPLATSPVHAQSGLTCQQALNSLDVYQATDEHLTTLYYINYALLLCDADQHEALLEQREMVRRERFPDGYRILERDASFESNGAMLAGTLFYPDAAGPFPALVVVHGSGRMTRTDFMGPAEGLVPLGYAVLVYDKRGVGESEGVYQNVGTYNSDDVLNELADDAAAGADLLATQTDIDPERIGIIGWSQASWIIPLAAAKTDNIHYMVNVVGPVMSVGAELFYSRLSGDEGGEGGEPLMEWEDLQESVFEFDGPHGFDPVPVLESVNIPGLWVLGELDHSISTPLTVSNLDRLITEFDKPFEYIIFPNSGHGLRDFDTGERVASWQAITEWLAEQTAN